MQVHAMKFCFNNSAAKICPTDICVLEPRPAYNYGFSEISAA